jgi:hypothetical protein
MKRREFFPAIAAFAVAPLAPAKETDAMAIDWNRSMRTYRSCDDGGWREVKPWNVRVGDLVICIGIDGDELWRAHEFEVASVTCDPDKDPRDVKSYTLYVEPDTKTDYLYENFGEISPQPKE